jgi:hypothetical protein
LGRTDRHGKANNSFSRLCESSLNGVRFLHGPIRNNKICSNFCVSPVRIYGFIAVYVAIQRWCAG